MRASVLQSISTNRRRRGERRLRYQIGGLLNLHCSGCVDRFVRPSATGSACVSGGAVWNREDYCTSDEAFPFSTTAEAS